MQFCKSGEYKFSPIGNVVAPVVDCRNIRVCFIAPVTGLASYTSYQIKCQLIQRGYDLQSVVIIFCQTSIG